jgi:hypothetical protein
MKRFQALRLLYAGSIIAVAFGSALIGCSSKSAGTRSGNLGKGGFSYQCLNGAADFACGSANKTTPTTFPAAVAEGSYFGITFQPSDTAAAGNPSLRSVSDDYLTSDTPGEFLAKKPGRSAIVARSSTDGRFVDYTLVTVAPISTLRMMRQGEFVDDKLSMRVGDAFDFRALPMNVRGDGLAGMVPYDWKSTDSEVLKLDGANPSATINGRAIRAGTSTLTANVGSHTISIDITVTP